MSSDDLSSESSLPQLNHHALNILSDAIILSRVIDSNPSTLTSPSLVIKIVEDNVRFTPPLLTPVNAVTCSSHLKEVDADITFPFLS
jgi:hypothetical protein